MLHVSQIFPPELFSIHIGDVYTIVTSSERLIGSIGIYVAEYFTETYITNVRCR